MTTNAARLQALLQSRSLVPLAGVYDAMSARLAELAGLPAIYLSGYCVSATQLGLPDVGYLTMTEMLSTAGRITDSVGIPMIVDGDDGYGNHLNVGRMVRALERMGAAGVQIEDQVAPKRCGHMQGKRVVSRQAMLDKLNAALDARTDPDFLIVARTDAIAVEGFTSAMERALAYEATGVAAVFVEAPENEAQVREIASHIQAPKVFNWALGGRSPTTDPETLEALGYAFLLSPDIVFPVARTLLDVYREVQRSGTYGALRDRMMSFDEFNETIGLRAVAELDRKYGQSD
ncbi:MAG TPA: oxaloacetate decarboxylase [Paracoccus sp. (in: a-proteobacteria)]|uniref:isocitrate lyase/PEP mutase family protein n=1 Tax=Paracoccus sp. TaxID=267 RepID=UPI002C29CA22|nr:oxaloacetate decarboxylase [Paracoccus sp. (in: a-proteobacteria)]HWL55462.1 oxaloacetate decarboxylase [Paracoccus sp. (in: a-proteobacteria)]